MTTIPHNEIPTTAFGLLSAGHQEALRYYQDLPDYEVHLFSGSTWIRRAGGGFSDTHTYRVIRKEPEYTHDTFSRELLAVLPDDAWIARDKDSTIRVFRTKPWCSANVFCNSRSFRISGGLFDHHTTRGTMPWDRSLQSVRDLKKAAGLL